MKHKTVLNPNNRHSIGKPLKISSTYEPKPTHQQTGDQRILSFRHAVLLLTASVINQKPGQVQIPDLRVDEKTIVPLDARAGYLEARRLVAERGMELPSNLLHDEYLINTRNRKQITGLYPSWAREILAYPKKGDVFKKGEDIVDSGQGWGSCRFVLPASYIPEEAVGVRDVSLYIDPEEVKEENGKPIVHPRYVIVLSRISRGDIYTNVNKEDEALPEAESLFPQIKWFRGISGVGVRPIVRLSDQFGADAIYQADASCPHDFGFGVAGEAAEVKPMQGLANLLSDINEDVCEKPLVASAEIDEDVSFEPPVSTAPTAGSKLQMMQNMMMAFGAVVGNRAAYNLIQANKDRDSTGDAVQMALALKGDRKEKARGWLDHEDDRKRRAERKIEEMKKKTMKGMMVLKKTK